MNGAHVYAEAARQLGLTMSPPGGPGLLTATLELSGHVAGQPIRVQRHIGRSPRLFVSAPLHPALDLGLAVRPAGAIESMRDLLGAVDVTVGHPRFDGAFAVRADEPGRAQRLLRPAVCEAALRCGASVRMDDDEVGIDFMNMAPFQDPAQLIGLVQDLAALAQAVDAARVETPPAAELGALASSLAAFAHANDLRLEATAPTRVSGVLSGVPVWLVSRRLKKGAYGLEIGVRFGQALPFWMGVRTAAMGFGRSLWARDVQVGDEAFDAAFDVSLHPDALPALLALLDAPRRAELVALGQGRELVLEPGGLLVRDDARDFDAATAIDVIGRMADFARRLGQQAAAGAYR